MTNIVKLWGEWLTTAEFSRRYGVSARTLQRWVKGGKAEKNPAPGPATYRCRDMSLLVNETPASPHTEPPNDATQSATSDVVSQGMSQIVACLENMTGEIAGIRGDSARLERAELRADKAEDEVERLRRKLNTLRSAQRLKLRLKRR